MKGEAFSEIVERHSWERKAQGVIPGTARLSRPMMGEFGERWWEEVRQDDTLSLEALLTAGELAGFADDAGTVRIAERSLADAVSRPDPAGHTDATVQRGLRMLVDRGHIEVTNAGAPPSHRRVLQLLLVSNFILTQESCTQALSGIAS